MTQDQKMAVLGSNFVKIRGAILGSIQHLPPWCDRNDAIQIGMMGALKAAPRLKRGGHIAASYLAIRAKGAVKDYCRVELGTRRAQRVTLHQLQQNGMCYGQETVHAALVVEPDAVVRLALKRCGVLMLESLPARLRKVLLLRYWHNLNNAETADQMKVSTGRISQMEKRAAELLRAELERRGIKSLRDVI